MSKTAQELLDAVDQAIYDVVTSGVAFFGGAGKQYTVNDLSKLRMLRADLQREVAAESSGNFRLGTHLQRR